MHIIQQIVHTIIMKPIKKKKKNTFLLLELLVAIALFILFIIPTISFPMTHLKKQRKEVTLLHLHLKGEEILNSLEEKFRTGEISWETLEKSAKEKNFLLEVQKKITLDKDLPFLIEPHIFLNGTVITPEEKSQNSFGKTTISVELKSASPPYKKLHSTHSKIFIAKKIQFSATHSQPS